MATPEGQYLVDRLQWVEDATLSSNVQVSLTPSANGELTCGTNSSANTEVLIKNIRNPVDNQDAATKAYVDTQVTTAGGNWKEPVNAASTANIGFTYGAGGAITGAPTTLDGVTVTTAGQRVLVKDQTNAYENGIYTVASSGVWARATDMADGSDAYGVTTYVLAGTANDARTFIQTANVVVGDANTQVWEEQGVAAPGLDTQVMFNDNGVLAGNADLTFDKATDTLQIGAVADSNVSLGGGEMVITTNADTTRFTGQADVEILVEQTDSNVTLRTNASNADVILNANAADSNVVISSTATQVQLSSGTDTTITATENVNITTTKDTTITATENVNINSTLDTKITATENVSITSTKDTTITATENVRITSSLADTNAPLDAIDITTTTANALIRMDTVGSQANVTVATSGEDAMIKIETTGGNSFIKMETTEYGSNIIIQANQTDINPGNVFINADATGPVSTTWRTGSHVSINGGATSNTTSALAAGGYVEINGGNLPTGSNPSASAGSIDLTGGDALASASSGGSINIVGGTSTFGSAGDVNITSGTSPGTGTS